MNILNLVSLWLDTNYHKQTTKCRVPQAHGKMRKAHDKAFAVRCTRQRVHGTVADGEDHLCREPRTSTRQRLKGLPCARRGARQIFDGGRCPSTASALCRAPAWSSRQRIHMLCLSFLAEGFTSAYGKILLFVVCSMLSPR